MPAQIIDLETELAKPKTGEEIDRVIAKLVKFGFSMPSSLVDQDAGTADIDAAKEAYRFALKNRPMKGIQEIAAELAEGRHEKFRRYLPTPMEFSGMVADRCKTRRETLIALRQRHETVKELEDRNKRINGMSEAEKERRRQRVAQVRQMMAESARAAE